MTGIVNSTGARSGVIGTTVGTPAVDAGKTVFSGWEADHNTTGDSYAYPEIDTFIQALDTDYATISGDTITIVKAGYYFIHAQAHMHEDNDTSRLMKIIIDGTQKSFYTKVAPEWETIATSYSSYLATDAVIAIGCKVGGTSTPYAWHGMESPTYFSVCSLIFLGS
jgi:hypothetical protein